MEIIEQNFKEENESLAEANFVYLTMSLKAKRNIYGYELLKVKLQNGNDYCIVVESNSTDKSNRVTNYFFTNEEVNFDTIKEFFINKNGKYLKFKNEAYFRVINLNNDQETKYVFTNYNDSFEFLEILDQKKN